MIVWSKGLGKQTLPMELDKATLRAESDHLAMDGIIEPVWWNYTMKLYTQDLGDFMKLLASPKTANFLAKERGILFPFVRSLSIFIPKLAVKVVWARTIGKLKKKEPAVAEETG